MTVRRESYAGVMASNPHLTAYIAIAIGVVVAIIMGFNAMFWTGDPDP